MKAIQTTAARFELKYKCRANSNRMILDSLQRKQASITRSAKCVAPKILYITFMKDSLKGKVCCNFDTLKLSNTTINFKSYQCAYSISGSVPLQEEQFHEKNHSSFFSA